MRIWIAIGLACVLWTSPSGAADVWTGCIPQVREIVGEKPLVGDAHLVGDAPENPAVPTVLGCYTGELEDENDADSYWLLPGWHGLAGMHFAVWGLEGCVSARITLQDTGASATLSVCEGERRDILVLGVHIVHVTFSEGPGIYQFAFE